MFNEQIVHNENEIEVLHNCGCAGKITFLLVAGTLGLSFPHFDFESEFRLNHLVLHRWQFEFMG